MKKFYTKVDKRSRKAMIEFLTNHFRYFTMNPWNYSKSYANNLKVNQLGLPSEIVSKLHDLIETQEFYNMIYGLIREFAIEHDYKWQCEFNGQSNGYLVLYKGEKEDSGYKSHCTLCDQHSYKLALTETSSPEERVYAVVDNNMGTPNHLLKCCKKTFPDLQLSDAEILKIITRRIYSRKTEGIYTLDNRCGRCGGMTRENLENPIYNIVIYSGQGVDDDEDFFDWDMNFLKERVELVQEFDKLCDQLVEKAIYIAENFEIDEEEHLVPISRRVLVKKV